MRRKARAMARLQILELPEGASDERPPFVLVIDQATEQTAAALSTESEVSEMLPPYRQPRTRALTLAEQIGARAVLVFEDTVEIPGNQVTLDDGQVVRLKVEPNLGAFRERVEQAVADAQRRLGDALQERREP